MKPTDEVPCPACQGAGAPKCCDNEGIVLRWIAEAMTTGEVR